MKVKVPHSKFTVSKFDKTTKKFNLAQSAALCHNFINEDYTTVRDCDLIINETVDQLT